jgi:hypothetical protein
VGYREQAAADSSNLSCGKNDGKIEFLRGLEKLRRREINLVCDKQNFLSHLENLRRRELNFVCDK